MVFSRTILIVITLTLLLPVASAHAPLGSGDNEDLAHATVIPDATKSWAIYGELHEGGEAQYYTFTMAKGQGIHLALMTTTASEDAGFQPTLVLMGPGIPTGGSVPDYVEVPPGVGVLVVEGVRSTAATYEAFAPSSFREVADAALEAPEDGGYYVAVHEPDRGGHYSLAVGDRESFTPTEWILTPLALLSVYQWSYQPLAVVLAPAMIVFALGVVSLVRRHLRGKPLDWTGWGGALAALLYLGTAATVSTQMGLSLSRSNPDASLVITLVFIVVAVLVAVATLRLALRLGPRTPRTRIYLLLLAGVALVAWAGFVVGPMVAMVAAVLPRRGSVVSTKASEA